MTDEPTKPSPLAACVARMKAHGLSGKLRDDAAGHFLAGVAAASDFEPPAEPVKYIDVLEALAGD